MLAFIGGVSQGVSDQHFNKVDTQADIHDVASS